MVLIEVTANTPQEAIKGFRPLTGIMVLIKGTAGETKVGSKLFPSPYGDYGSYRNADRADSGLGVSFRPLTGIMVLIRTPYKWLHRAIKNAFCGADFLFSSFFTFLWKMIFKNRPIADF